MLQYPSQTCCVCGSNMVVHLTGKVDRYVCFNCHTHLAVAEKKK